MKRGDPNINYLQEIHFNYKNINRLKVKWWNKIYHANTSQKKAEVALLKLVKVDFRAKTIMRD